MYRIELLPRAVRELAKLPRPAQQRLASVITALAATPRPPGVKALQGPARLLRVRAGAYRVLYQVNDNARTVLIVRAGNRRDVYRGL